jgi:SAM-dependent methyltransferase
MTTSARFRAAYARHRAAEGRGAGGDSELLALPYQRIGPWARHWAVRARTYRRFLARVVAPRAREVGHPLSVLDLGAGNGWLCYRLARDGHHPAALDWRRDTVDGLGAAAGYGPHLPALFPRIAASFEAIPLADRRFDIVVFNAAIHYAVDLARTMAEAARVCAGGGRIVILDSPCYAREEDGAVMVAEKRQAMAREAGDSAADLLALPAIEYLTRERLQRASATTGLAWRRHRVWYPLWYELRGLTARLRGRRRPSRFDLWETVVPP